MASASNDIYGCSADVVYLDYLLSKVCRRLVHDSSRGKHRQLYCILDHYRLGGAYSPIALVSAGD